MNRVHVYIDGCNLYHALDNWVRSEAKKNKILEDHSLQWLDLKQLAENLCEKMFLQKDNACVKKVYYFSAYGGMKKRKDLSLKERNAGDKRHRIYVKALERKDVECDLSLFSHPHKVFPLAKGLNWISPKEKESDVKLTIQIMEDAFKNKFDIGVIISSDSDFVPLLKKIREAYHKQFMVGITENRIVNKRDRKRKDNIYGKENILVISRALIEQCQLPDVIPPVGDPDAKTIFRPAKYCKPVSHAS